MEKGREKLLLDTLLEKEVDERVVIIYKEHHRIPVCCRYEADDQACSSEISVTLGRRWNN